MEPTLRELLEREAVTVGELRAATPGLTPEGFLALSPRSALLESPGLGRPERPIRPEAGRGERDRELRARVEAAGRDPGLDTRRVFFLDAGSAGQLVAGRSADHADLVLPEGTISKRHLRLRRLEGRRWTALDLESANGSWLEGSRLPAGVPTPLLAGQVLQVATFTCVFLQPEQLWTLIAPAGSDSQLVLPAEGLPVRELITALAGMSEATFLALCPDPFLLQLPTDAEAEDDADKGGSTLPLSRTRILSPKRRTQQLGEALVHHLEPTAEALVLGRADDCDLILPEPSVSKRHAELRRRGDRWLLTDLGSQNGVWVEGQRIEAGLPTALDDGQRVLFSSYQALFLSPPRMWELIQHVIRRRS